MSAKVLLILTLFSLKCVHCGDLYARDPEAYNRNYNYFIVGMVILGILIAICTCYQIKKEEEEEGN